MGLGRGQGKAESFGTFLGGGFRVQGVRVQKMQRNRQFFPYLNPDTLNPVYNRGRPNDSAPGFRVSGLRRGTSSNEEVPEGGTIWSVLPRQS